MLDRLILSTLICSLCCSVVACGGDDDDGLPVDVADPTKCGPAPHVTVKARAVLLGLTGTTSAAAARFTSEVCPTKVFVTDAGGRLTAGFTKDYPYVLRGELEGSFPILGAEAKLSEDVELSGAFIPKALKGLLPEEFTDTSGMLIATTSVAPGTTGVCADRSGIEITVAGGAKSLYFQPGTVPRLDRALMRTSPGGVASAVRVPLDEMVQISASKPGCTAELSMFGETGRARFEAGTITLGVIRLSN